MNEQNTVPTDNLKKSYNLFSLKRPGAGNTLPIATSGDEPSGSFYSRRSANFRDYSSPEEIEKIISTGNKDELVSLSRYYFSKDGFYKQLVLHFANLLYYRGLVIPNPKFGVELSNDDVQERYTKAITFIDSMNLSDFCVNAATRTLVDGSYFGVILEASEENFAVLELPNHYCKSEYRDQYGNDLVQFDLSYFNNLTDTKVRNTTLRTYPKVIREAYKNFRNNKRGNWYLIPSDIGLCFQMATDRPYFLHTIPAIMDYDDSVKVDKERDLEEIRKIIVQKIPHDSDNNFLLEPDEALELHEGTVEMVSKNKNISVLTTYADVDSIVSKTSAEANNNKIEKTLQHFFNKAGISSQLFSSTGSTTLQASLKEDLSVMWSFVLKLQRFVSGLINTLYGDKNVSFKFMFLPVGVHNEQDYITMYKDLASLGYSWLVPAAAMGINQVDLVNLKSLEHDVLKLQDTLIPLQSSFQASDKGPGAPAKEDEDKAPKTIQNEVSKDNTQGGS